MRAHRPTAAVIPGYAGNEPIPAGDGSRHREHHQETEQERSPNSPDEVEEKGRRSFVCPPPADGAVRRGRSSGRRTAGGLFSVAGVTNSSATGPPALNDPRVLDRLIELAHAAPAGRRR
jgi:hypothetical protein